MSTFGLFRTLEAKGVSDCYPFLQVYWSTLSIIYSVFHLTTQKIVSRHGGYHSKSVRKCPGHPIPAKEE